MSMHPTASILILLSAWGTAAAQEYGKPDRDQPGDEMIQAYLNSEAETIQGGMAADFEGLETWTQRRDGYRQEYLYMLGLWPLPERTPLQVSVTGTLRRPGIVIEKLCYQSRPRLYVTANLYRPEVIPQGTRLPGVLYVCGHAGRGRNGNKAAFQSHGLWFARHGYVCLVVDTLQLGEIAGVHHGTYREGRWWWLSRGYTPAGVECWNGVRGIDYLTSRPDVDPDRIAVTGISGGGAATFWIAAADERVRVAVPVSGMADLASYVPNRVINGHCDCMFLHNAMRWPWTRIAALVAPRPLLFVNSHEDPIFPMDANERVIASLERIYAMHGAGDRVDAVVSLGGHDYRADIRRAAYRWINAHLLGDPRSVEDSEVDLVTGSQGASDHPIPPEELRVFPGDADIPSDQLNTTVDQHFVPRARLDVPAPGGFGPWKATILAELRRVSFGSLPPRVPPASPVEGGKPGETIIETEPGIRVPLVAVAGQAVKAERIVLIVAPPDGDSADDPGRVAERIPAGRRDGDATYIIWPRGTGPTRWTRKNPPNHVERSLVLLGRTADTGRVRDVAAAARHLKRAHGGAPVWVGGLGAAGIVATYAALLDDEIDGAIVAEPPASHMEEGAPAILNVLRVCDIPEALGLLAPRPLQVTGLEPGAFLRVQEIYRAAGAEAALAPPGSSR